MYPMTFFQVISPGTKCLLTHADRGEALVLAVTLRQGGPALYEIAWWSNGSRQTAWVEPHEIQAKDGAPQVRIGFAEGK